jgi:hypothetical protein
MVGRKSDPFGNLSSAGGGGGGGIIQEDGHWTVKFLIFSSTFKERIRLL